MGAIDRAKKDIDSIPIYIRNEEGEEEIIGYRKQKKSLWERIKGK